MSYEYDDVDDGANNLLWGRLAALAVFAVLIFSLGYCAAPNGVPQEELALRDAEITKLRQDNEQLSGALRSRPSEQPSPDPSASPSSADASDEPSPGGASGDERTYTVVSGDTLASISGKVYDDPSKFDLIVEANDLNANDVINVGDELIIPPDPGGDGSGGADSNDAGTDDSSDSGTDGGSESGTGSGDASADPEPSESG